MGVDSKAGDGENKKNIKIGEAEYGIKMMMERD